MNDYKVGFSFLVKWFILWVVLSGTTGCKSQPAPDQATLPIPTSATIPFSPEQTAIPTRTITPLPVTMIASPTGTPLPSPTSTVSLPLNPIGPWIFDDLGERVFSLDGGSAELAQLDIGEAFNHYAIAPQGGWLAIKPGNNNPWSTDTVYELWLYHLPNNQPVQRILLLGDQAREVVRQAADHEVPNPMGPAVANSLFFADNMLWSSNARYLAFAGALDGASTDIYLYDTDSDSVQRLTSEDEQVVLMDWSPDDQTIIYATAEQVFDIGFHALLTVWAVDIESGETKPLFSARAGEESIHGWIDTNTFIVDAYDFESPHWGLSRVNIAQPGLQLLMEGYFDIADLDPVSGTILLQINGVFFWEPTIPKGIYRLDTQNGGIEMQIAGENLSLRGWLADINAFTIYDTGTDQVIFFNPNGETILTLPLPGGNYYPYPAPSPDGQFIVVGGTTIYTLSGELVTAWTRSRFLTWLPDSSGVVAGNCSQGFFEVRYSTDDWQPVQLITPVQEYCNYRIVP